MNQTGISQFNQARIEWAIRLRYSPMPDLDMERITRQLNEFRIGELRTVGKTWEVMMERDGELAINSEKRKADSATLDWQIATDGSPDGDKHAAALRYFYNNLTATKALDQDSTGGLDDLIYQVLSALDYYYSAHEILLRVDNPAAREVTAEFRHTPVWFFEARRGYLGYLKHIFDLYGQPCIAGEWLTAVNTGWMRPLSVAYGAKWSVISDWLTFCERYGSGFLEGITEAAKDTPEWNEAAEALRTLTNDASVLHHKSVQFKFLEHPSKNQLPFQPMAEQVDRLYAKCYRGVDLATASRASTGSARGSGLAGGSNPVGASVQREESGILLVRDAKWVTGVFNDRIDRPILRYLFNEEPRAWFALIPPLNDTTAEDLQTLRTLVPMGLRVALKEVYQRFRWSVPAADEPCLSGSPTPSVQNPKSGDGAPESAGAPPASSSAEGEMQNEKNAENEDEKTLAAQTGDSTPIAAGADPAHNPGLVGPQSASRQMPDTQVDASDFWSRTGLAPRAADGQVLPMPSLGYAVPNVQSKVTDTEALKDRLNDLKARGLGHCRAAQALQAEINRRATLNIQPPTLNQTAVANAGFNPKEPRDKYGQWTTNGDSTKTNGSAQRPASTAEQFKVTTPTMSWQGFHGTEADYIALHPNDSFYRPISSVNEPKTSVVAKIGKAFGTAGRVLSGGLADLGETITGNPTHENISAAIHGEPMPMIAESRFLPTPLRILERGSQGLVESAPKIAVVAGLQAAGVPAPVSAGLVFGTTEQGFDPKQGLIAAALPVFGKYTGSLTEAIASKAGVSSEAALQALNKIGGAAGAASLISADQLQEIMKLPPENRKDALIEAAANVGSTFLLGMLGERKSSETQSKGGQQSGTGNVQKGLATVHRVVEPGKPQFQLKSGESGLSVFDGSKVSSKDVVPHFRGGSQVTTKTISEIESHGLVVEKTPGHPKLPQHLQDAHMEIRPGPGMERTQFKQAIKKLEPKGNQQ